MIDVGAKTLIQYGLVALALIGLCWGLVLWGEARKQQEWDASLMEQAIKSASTVIASAENTAKVETKHAETRNKTRTVVKVVEKEVIKYVETADSQCILSPSFEWRFDLVSRMLDEAGSERMPTADSPASEFALPAGRAATDTEVLRAYFEAITRWREERDRNRALSEWVITNYETSHRTQQ